jgi:hypothetical protein
MSLREFMGSVVGGMDAEALRVPLYMPTLHADGKWRVVSALWNPGMILIIA